MTVSRPSRDARGPRHAAAQDALEGVGMVVLVAAGFAAFAVVVSLLVALAT